MMIGIVTGASAGLGTEFARQLDARQLDELWLIARRRDRLEALRKTLTTPARVLPLDLRQPQEIDRVRELLARESPAVRYLVNNAGFGKLGDFADLPLTDQLEMIDVNVRAVVHLTHVCLPHMSSGSCLLHVSSVAGFAPLGGFTVYAATKAFVTHFSIGLLPELKRRGVHSIAVCPGPVDTEFSSVAHTGSHRQKRMFTTKARAEDVVRKALRDADHHRSVSIYGGRAKLIPLAARLVPKSVIASISCRAIYREV